jgi:hypothetical protein
MTDIGGVLPLYRDATDPKFHSNVIYANERNANASILNFTYQVSQQMLLLD